MENQVKQTKRNTIKRDTIFIETVALTKTCICEAGELLGFYKLENCWATRDSNNKGYRGLVSHLRNGEYYKFLRQFSMIDIVDYLKFKDENYQTVSDERLVQVIETTFEETKVTCLDDIYNYIKKHLL